MQDRYAGDIGDFGKIALLRALEGAGLSVGVNWYKTDTAPDEIHDDGKYRIREKYESCDPELYEKLDNIFIKGPRSIAALQEAKLLRSDKYFGEVTPPKSDRAAWQSKALEVLGGCDLVFLDPDNGLSVSSARESSPKSAKYVYLDEVTDYIAAGKSVMFYNHRQRKKAEEYFASFRQRFAAEKDINGKPVFALTFPKCAVRDYFIIAATEEHRQKIECAIRSMLTGPFGKKGICKFRTGFSNIGITVCPFCGYGPPIEIVYGMPTYKAEQAAKRGEIMLGGCCVTDSDPKWCCPSCRRKF
jgi:hypothetical protein